MQMSTTFTDTLRALMSQYSFEMDADSTIEDLTCIVCRRLMVDAYQTSCGCQYCRECLLKYVADGEKFCRGGKVECTDENLVLDRNVFKNGMLDRKVLKSKVHCPNRSCASLIELSQMEEHHRLCAEQLVECPFSTIGCDNEGSSKESIVSHLTEYAYTHSQLLIEVIQNLRNEVNGLKDNFQASRLEIETLREDLKVKDMEINEQRERMKKVELDMTNLRKEVTENAVHQIVESTPNIENRETIYDNKESKREKMEDVMEEVTTLKKELVEVSEYLSFVKKSMDTMKSGHSEVLNETDITTLVVDKYSSRKTSNGKMKSPRFYSHPNGYKLRLRIYPGGRDEGSGTHMSLVFVICKGEYDDVLPWPCRHTFTVSVINQRNYERHASVIHAFSLSKGNSVPSFNKPTKKDNVGYGYSKFISNFCLQSVVGLIENDSVIIKCSVSSRRDSFS